MNVDEIYDLLLEMELGTPPEESLGPEGAEVMVDAGSEAGAMEAAAPADTGVGTAETAGADESGRPTAFGRYRNAALVGAGGLACAAVGAFLGGLGGYFTVAPASAHAIGASTPDGSLADAVNGAAASHSDLGGRGSAASGRATLADVEGSLTKGISTFSLFNAGSGAGTAATTAGSVVGSSGSGGSGGSGAGGSGTSCVSGGAGLSDLIDTITCTLSSIGSLPGSGGSGLPGGLGGLGGLVSDVSGTLAGLGVSGSLPTSAGVSLPSGSGAGGSLSGVLNTVAATASGMTKGGAGSLPLPGSGNGSGSGSLPTMPSLPVSTTTLPTVPGTPTVTSNGGSTTLSVPTPSIPVPVGTTITIGGVSFGVNSGGSAPGATLNLPVAVGLLAGVAWRTSRP